MVAGVGAGAGGLLTGAGAGGFEVGPACGAGAGTTGFGVCRVVVVLVVPPGVEGVVVGPA